MAAHREHVRRRADLVTTIALTFISGCALFVTIWQTRVMQAQQEVMLAQRDEMRKQQELMLQQMKLSALPIVQMGNIFEGGSIGIAISNKGIGPALVQKAQVYADGQPLRNLEHLVIWLDSASEHTGASYIDWGLWWQTNLDQQTILPGERLTVFRTNDERLQNLLIRYGDRLRVEVCYASAYGETWLHRFGTDKQQKNQEKGNRPCEACPATLMDLPTSW